MCPDLHVMERTTRFELATLTLAMRWKHPSDLRKRDRGRRIRPSRPAPCWRSVACVACKWHETGTTFSNAKYHCFRNFKVMLTLNGAIVSNANRFAYAATRAITHRSLSLVARRWHDGWRR